MRIAVATWSQRVTGGIETYLGQLLPALAARGHHVAFWSEVDEPKERPALVLPPAHWCAADAGPSAALAALREWRPDVIYAHGLHSPFHEAQLPAIAPVAQFIHAYHGTCAGGAKTFHFPAVQPCSRTFGLMCLAYYYPRRCGGLNPATMLRQYREQSNRLENLRSVSAILVHSEHMAGEYRRHGFTHKVRKVRFPVEIKNVPPPTLVEKPAGAAWNLLFLGRMEGIKGGATLIEALPRTAKALNRPLRLIFAGDGGERSKWERRAKQISAQNPQVKIEFTGWVEAARRTELLQQTDLLVVPSLWPEPFGMVGIEAAHFGVPGAAFRVGGIEEWLHDGVSGHLAPGNPPTAQGLAEAITACLQTTEGHLKLRKGALAMSKHFTMLAHLDDICGVFDEIIQDADSLSRRS